jgi:hypothetical protein
MPHTTALRRYAVGSSAARLAAVLLSAAGAIHLGAAPQHWADSPAQGIFLFVVGLGELVWAGVFWRRPSEGSTAAGVVLAGGSIVLWAITRVLPAPFGHGPEEMGLLDLGATVTEVLALGILLPKSAGRPVDEDPGEPAWVPAAGLLGLAAAAGVLTFSLAMVAEPGLPWLAVDHRTENPAVATPALRGQVADRWQVVVAGIGTPLASGDARPVAGDLLAQVTFGTGVERFGRELDLRLYRSSGAPVSNASIVATGQMRFMDHGTFRQAATPSVDGQYVLPLAFVMPGEWRVDLEIATPTERANMQLDLDFID